MLTWIIWEHESNIHVEQPSKQILNIAIFNCSFFNAFARLPQSSDHVLSGMPEVEDNPIEGWGSTMVNEFVFLHSSLGDIVKLLPTSHETASGAAGLGQGFPIASSDLRDKSYRDLSRKEGSGGHLVALSQRR